jgi:hypothetical protein
MVNREWRMTTQVLQRDGMQEQEYSNKQGIFQKPGYAGLFLFLGKFSVLILFF